MTCKRWNISYIITTEMLARNHEDSRSLCQTCQGGYIYSLIYIYIITSISQALNSIYIYIPCVDHVFTCIYTMCTSYMHTYIYINMCHLYIMYIHRYIIILLPLVGTTMIQQPPVSRVPRIQPLAHELRTRYPAVVSACAPGTVRWSHKNGGTRGWGGNR